MAILMWIGAFAVSFAATAGVIELGGVFGSVGVFPPFMLQGLFTVTTLACAGGILSAALAGAEEDDDE